MINQGQPLLSFRVDGVAQSRGSKRPITAKGSRRGLLIDSNPKAKPWMEVVRVVARQAMRDAGYIEPFNFALSMTMTIFRPRIKGHYGTKGLKPSAPAFPTTKPDVGKYARAIEDAMSGTVYVDDSYLVDSWPSKRWGEPGVEIKLWRAE